ncbi:MAG: peptidase domain-containing ABC transporter [Bacilli bacterium]
MKKNLIVLQHGNKDCGSASLLSVIRYYGGDISLERLSELTKTTKEGTNFYNLSTAARELGLDNRAYKVENIDQIKNLVPFISQINNKEYTHFVVVYKITESNVELMDPSCGKRIINLFDFCSIWTGNIMIFEKIKPLPYFKTSKIIEKAIIQTLIKNKPIILFLITLSIILTCLSCFLSLYSQIIFDNIINTSINNLIIITIIFSVLYIIKNITSFVRNHLIIYLNQKLDVSIFLSSFSKIILLPYMYYKNRATSEVLSRLNDLTCVKNFISKVIVFTFLDILTFILAIIIIYTINLDIFFILIGVSLIYVIIMFIFNRPVKELTKIVMEDNSSLNNTIIESVSSFETVKGLNIEDNTILNFSKSYSNLLNSSYELEKINNICQTSKEIVSNLILLIISFISFKNIMNNTLTTGNYMTITFLVGYIIYPIKNMFDLLNDYHITKESLNRANSLLEMEEEDLTNMTNLKVTGNITITNLSYTYNNKNYVLDNLSLHFRDKDRILIVGSSGSGKSTLLKLLYKYYNVPRDKIFIGPYDINDYTLNDIRKEITYISQNEILYTKTIRDNILLGRNISEEKFLDICKLTCVEDIVRNSILGYDYLLEENGINISGGQRQRIILARSLLKEAKIIMIDEGLNQIDINLERIILNNIFNYFSDKTFIVISHRRENSDLYNRLIELDKGKLKNNLIRRKNI